MYIYTLYTFLRVDIGKEICVYIYICMYICMYVCMYVYEYVHIQIRARGLSRGIFDFFVSWEKGTVK